MVVKRSGLGRNLSALLGQSATALVNAGSNPLIEQRILAIDSLQPGKYQPRADMDQEALTQLTESIKKQGLLQPLLVREIAEGQYEIIAGERRWRACQLADLTQVPVLVHQVDDETAMAMALVENLQREDLNAMDQARAMHRLASEFSLTHQQIAELLSKSRAAVTNFLRLLQLPEEVRKMVELGQLEMGHARSLLMLDTEQQYQVAKLVVAKRLSVRETEALVQRVKNGRNAVSREQDCVPLTTDDLQSLTKYLGTQVKIKPGQAGRGSLIIQYDNAASLQRIIDQLLRVHAVPEVS